MQASAVATTALPLPQFEYSIEAQVHSSIMLDEDFESLHCPASTGLRLKQLDLFFKQTCKLNAALKKKLGWCVCYY